MPLHNVEYCIICEDVRNETWGKLSILGFYGLAPIVTIKVNEWGKPIKIVLLLGMGGISGKYEFSASIINPDGSALTADISTEVDFEAVEDDTNTLGWLYPSLIFRQEGIYSFQLSMNGQQIFRTTFRVKRTQQSK
jgi:hypothetical protein